METPAKAKSIKNTNTKEVKTVATTTANTKTSAPAKNTTEKVDFTDSINKVKETAKVVNTEIKEAATEIVKDLKEVSQDVTSVATKGLKEVSKKVDFSDSVKTVKESAAVVNTQLKETANVVATDIKEARKEIVDVTTKLAKEAVENLNVSERMNSLKNAVINTNNYALEVSEELIKGIETNGEKWQNVAEKAIKSGLKLAERQEKIVFSTLEAVKGQVASSALRFKKLFQ